MVSKVQARTAALVVVLLVMAAPAAAHGAVFAFPSVRSEYAGAPAELAPDEIGAFGIEAGDLVSETFRAAPRVDRAILAVQTPSNGLGAPVAWALEINRTSVGTFVVPANAPGARQSLDVSFPPITGPSYEVVLRLLSVAPTGAHSFAAGGAFDHSLQLLDTLAPDTRILTGPDQRVFRFGTTAGFTFDSRDGDGRAFECSLDGAAFARCASPVSHSGLVLGSHTFRVRAVDEAGNIDPTPAEWTWKVTTLSSCPRASATVPAGVVTTLALTCTAYDPYPLTLSIVRPPGLGRLGAIDQASRTVAFTAPKVAGLTSFTYRAQSSGIVAYNVTVRGPIGSGVRPRWRVGKRSTQLRALAVTELPAGAVVSVRCRARCARQARFGPFAGPRKALSVLAVLDGVRLRPGAVFDVRIAAPYAEAKAVRFTVRSHGQPHRTTVRSRPAG
jgi:hypothetical protein